MLKEIPGFDGYLITEDGNVYSRKRNKFLKSKLDKYGYRAYVLSINGKNKYITAHRLVAITYIENPNHYPCVNHKNENKQDNRVENLEWCTVKYNDNYGHRNRNMAMTKERMPVIQIRNDGNEIMFRGVKDASRKTGINRCQISRVCRGLSMTAGGYKWRYVNG